jgi:branched-chain amino acid transport system substrate-binding protein
MDDYAKRFPGKTVDVFAMQGYDSARVIVDALNKVKGDTSNKDQFMDAIRSVTFDSPRGRFSFDPKTQNVMNQVYFRQVRDAGGRLENTIIGKTDNPISDPENM